MKMLEHDASGAWLAARRARRASERGRRLRLRVPRLAHVAGGQVKALRMLAKPAQERVLRRIAELKAGQADPFAQFDSKLHGSKPVVA